MNHINSVILAGVVVSPLSIQKSKETATFKLETCRRYRTSPGVYEDEAAVFTIRVWDRLAKICEKEIAPGRTVRIIGRAAQDHVSGCVVFVAEHIE
jgi:single-stranded DNA-binding protein